MVIVSFMHNRISYRSYSTFVLTLLHDIYDMINYFADIVRFYLENR